MGFEYIEYIKQITYNVAGGWPPLNTQSTDGCGSLSLILNPPQENISLCSKKPSSWMTFFKSLTPPLSPLSECPQM